MKLSEAIYNGLTNLGNSIERTNKAKRDYKLESIKLGLIPDHEKLHMLKQQLYHDSRVGKDTEQLGKAIDILRNEVNIQDKANKAFDRTFGGLVSNLLGISMIVGSVYFWGLSTENLCQSRNSQYCDTAYHGVLDYFYGAKKVK